MEIKRIISEYDIALLLALASKVCGEEGSIDAKTPFSKKQFQSLKAAVFKILVKLDAQVPGYIPGRPDGKPWSA